MDCKQQEHHHGHDHQDDAHRLDLLSSGQDDQQGHEKTSVLKKVKAKAKKLKDTITKHGHGHGDEQDQHHDHQYVDDDDDDDEDDTEFDEDVELVQDPEVHGAPGMGNADISSSSTRPKGNSGEHDGGATPLQSAQLPVGQVKNQTESPSLSSALLEDLEEDPYSPKHGGAQPLPGNYESKVTDPTGQNCGEACGITSSVGQSLDRMIERDTKPTSAAGSPAHPAQSTLPISTGSHDQFSQELSRPSTTVITESKECPAEENQGGGGYTEKLSGVTSALAGTAISAKNVVAAKLGYGEQKHNNNEEESYRSSVKKSNDDLKEEAANDSSGKDSSVAATVADKAINAKNVVASKLLGYNMEGAGPESEEKAKEKTGPNNNMSTGMGSWAEKLKPGEEHKVLSEMISDVLHISKKEARSIQEEQPPPAAAADNKSVKERVSDGLHKRNEEEDRKEQKPSALAKVTESEQVATQLGTQDEKSQDQTNAEKTVANTIKSAVSSWWSGGGEAGEKSPATTADK